MSSIDLFIFDGYDYSNNIIISGETGTPKKPKFKVILPTEMWIQ